MPVDVKTKDLSSFKCNYFSLQYPMHIPISNSFDPDEDKPSHRIVNFEIYPTDKYGFLNSKVDFADLE
jgi:hypothetical protein